MKKQVKKQKPTYGQKGGPVRYSNEYYDWKSAALRGDDRAMAAAEERWNRMMRNRRDDIIIKEDKVALALSRVGRIPPQQKAVINVKTGEISYVEAL